VGSANFLSRIPRKVGHVKVFGESCERGRGEESMVEEAFAKCIQGAFWGKDKKGETRARLSGGSRNWRRSLARLLAWVALGCLGCLGGAAQNTRRECKRP
jgi:hypothetical protein